MSSSGTYDFKTASSNSVKSPAKPQGEPATPIDLEEWAQPSPTNAAEEKSKPPDGGGRGSRSESEEEEEEKRPCCKRSTFIIAAAAALVLLAIIAIILILVFVIIGDSPASTSASSDGVIPTGDTPTAQAGIEQIDQQVDGKNIRVPSDENINNAEVKSLQERAPSEIKKR